MGVLNYVPVDAKGFRLAMGLRPLDESTWLEFGDDAADQLARKEALLRDERSRVVALRPEGERASEELFELIAANLATHHHRDAPRRVGEQALIAASRLVAEDLCVMVRHRNEWRLGAACVCFPSRWSLLDKIGTSLDDIHAPVPGYDSTLGAPTSRFFDRLTPDRGFWRLNWTLLDDPELFQPEPARRAPHSDPSSWQFRVERQTLRSLEHSEAAVFTIRTYVQPAGELVARLPSFASDVWTYLSSAPRATLEYKGWVGLADRWAEWYPASRVISPDTSPR